MANASSLARRLDGKTARPLDVLGVGEAGLDEVYSIASPLTAGAKLPAERQLLGGGQVATALVACAKLGRRAAFAGAVGDDEGGGAVLEGLAQAGVDVASARTVVGATRRALVIADGAGERTVLECAPPAVHAEALEVGRAASARVLHLDATNVPVSLAFARAARAAGTLVSIDLDEAAWKSARATGQSTALDELLAHADVLVTSAGLPEALTGASELAAALAALGARTGAALVGCTLGARGAVLLEAGAPAPIRVPAFAVTVATHPALRAGARLDTTGCGDVFRAALVCALLDGRSVADAGRFASAAAALKCRAAGRLGCPTRAEVEALLAG